MQFRIIEPPRKFKVGDSDAPIQLSHVMDIALGPDLGTAQTSSAAEIAPAL